jgi:predicted acetyltransferase
LFLKEIKEMGLAFVTIHAEIDNTTSQNVILKCGGEYIKYFAIEKSLGGGIGKKFIFI